MRTGNIAHKCFLLLFAYFGYLFVETFFNTNTENDFHRKEKESSNTARKESSSNNTANNNASPKNIDVRTNEVLCEKSSDIKNTVTTDDVKHTEE